MKPQVPRAAGAVGRGPAASGGDDEPLTAAGMDAAGMPTGPFTGATARPLRWPRHGVVFTRRPSRPDGELQEVAAAWDARCGRAQALCDDLHADHGRRPEVTAIERDGERLVVCIKAVTLADWERWLALIGADVCVETRQAGYAQLATGLRHDVPVHLVAHGVPLLLQRAFATAVQPHLLWGRVYDLSLPLAERGGRGPCWHFTGERTRDGIPLLARHGRGERRTLTGVVRHLGPLTPAGRPASL
ncbi:BN159_2729 family protein [Streptomyces sp. bgisy032]|uniref:BN159_2729 family protein n=1 Tax=Streptomyces sp. bgisy032 TaxID=3413773 RepID=UPI003D752827